MIGFSHPASATRGVSQVPAPAFGGALRRAVLLTGTALCWGTAWVLLDAALPPDEGEQWPLRLALCLLAALLVLAPVALFAVPAARRVQRCADALLAVADAHPAPELPPYRLWAGPEPMFRRMVLTGGSCAALPLLLLLGGALAFGLFLGEPTAAVTFALLAVLPALALVLVIQFPRWSAGQLEDGLAAGQQLPVRVGRRIDEGRLIGQSIRTWFDAELPDGQRVVLRTPLRFGWAGDVRRLVGAPDLVLAVAGRGWGGVLLSPSDPAAAVWLLGPVPLARVPRWVTHSFATT